MGHTVRFEAADGVAVITIDRPHVRNAVDRATAEAIDAALDELDARADLRAGILTGAGGCFCAGMDLKARAATGERPFTESRGALGIAGRPPATPLIAAVEGSALGGGFEIALACDLVVAASDARLGLPEVKRGLVAGGGGAIRLPRRIPSAVALEMLMTGEPISALRAYELGLVSRIAEPGLALDVARRLAASVAANAPLAVRTAKRIAYEAADWSLEEAFARQEPIVEAVRDSDDAREGARAFVEKREPVWRGR